MQLPPADVVHIWTVPLTATAATVSRLHGLLGLRERLRAADRAPADWWRRHVVSHAAVRAILGGYLDREPSSLRFGYGRWGKPRLAGLEFNLSHTGDLALLAVSAQRPVGVDVEGSRPDFPAVAFADRYFPPAERELVAAAGPEAPAVWRRLWSRKEACVKAAGARAALGLSLAVAGPGDLRRVRDSSGLLPGTWLLRDLPAPEGHAACVALDGDRPFAVTHQTWIADEAVRHREVP
ncbi:4'-phosphopantetheinyl transferase [Allocatelliglobosispora scoriae]|uniref:4'-phosphopantetheinyl transferase n=1 Tax=Allocatelliglobosispora scoriae TaxID=643052 RepID=A0A841BT88_9ACTN|nr:4'-phosphopantetheinyl transferase superfamily protein [Allocatelliglobosispora scoriae]MBB5870011.1 4'-phosphopantetheinyl transferase [Allocatelliglobosispora scoriae]